MGVCHCRLHGLGMGARLLIPRLLALAAGTVCVAGCAGGVVFPSLDTPPAASPSVPAFVASIERPPNDGLKPQLTAPPRSCPPLPADLAAEARRTTPVSSDMTGALMISELQKNRRLAEMAAAYERCRGR
jgi:hypothetical protein